MVDNTNPELYKTLRSVLAEVHLEDVLEALWEWTNESGAYDLEELAEKDVFDSLAKAIQLKPLQKKRLLEVIQRRIPASTPDLIVKNTFLEPAEKGSSKLAGNRAATVAHLPRHDSTATARPTSVPEECEDDLNSPSHISAQLLSTPLSTYTGAPSPFGFGAGAHYGILSQPLPTFDGFQDASIAPPGLPEPGTDEGDETSSDAQPPVDEATLTPLQLQLQMQMQMTLAMQQQAFQTGMMAGYGWPFPPMGSVAAAAQMQEYSQQMQMPDFEQQQQQQFAQSEAWHEASQDRSLPSSAAVAKDRKEIIERTRWGKGCERLMYTIDAKKLRSKDREDVSPIFKVGAMSFKIILRPKVMDNNRGGAGFDTSGRRGYVELKCMTDFETAGALETTSVRFRMSVGSRRGLETFRGPQTHDFAQRAIWQLPHGQDEWNFGKAVDRTTNTFAVCFEIFDDDSTK